jgi:membrane protease YdiL (CAAX protease family)
MTLLQYALALAIISSLLYAIAHMLYTVATTTTVGAALIATYYYFVTRDDESLTGSAA